MKKIKSEDKRQGIDSSNKKYFVITLIIYFSCFFIFPTGLGLLFSFLLFNPYIIEGSYLIFGSLSMLTALFRSWRRDSRNIRKEHTVVEDKNTTGYRLYRKQQTLFYVAGLISIALSAGIHYICIVLDLFD